MNYKELLSLTKNNPKCCSDTYERLLQKKTRPNDFSDASKKTGASHK